MRWFSCLVVIAFVGCTTSTNEKDEKRNDSIVAPTEKEVPKANKDSLQMPAVYANQRFKDVTVKRLSTDTFLVKGKGQIFEASFNWVIEDGHNEIKKGFATTDAGAPEWGNFSFVVEAIKDRENSTLTIILFEASAKDGSPQHELPIKLC